MLSWIDDSVAAEPGDLGAIRPEKRKGSARSEEQAEPLGKPGSQMNE